jgi:methionyl-tRNA formyltransferase
VLKKEDGEIDFGRSAQEIFNRFRGFQPWPGAFTFFRGKMLATTAARPCAERVPQAELRVSGERLFAGCGSGTSLELLEVQPEGKRKMPAKDFVNGYRPKAGEKLGR